MKVYNQDELDAAVAAEAHTLELAGTDHFVVPPGCVVRATGEVSIDAYGDAAIFAYDHVTVNAYDTAFVRAFNNAKAWVEDSTWVIGHDSARIKATGNAQAFALDHAYVIACDKAVVFASGHSFVELYDDSTGLVGEHARAEATDRARVRGITEIVADSDRDEGGVGDA